MSAPPQALEGEPLLDAAGSRAADQAAIAGGVAGTTLMAAAGRAAASVLQARHPHAASVLCVCGGGANGGDGLVVAQVLLAAGLRVRALVVADRPYAGDAAWAEGEARAAGVPIEPAGAAEIRAAAADADVVVDALLGTGFSGAPRDEVAAAIEAVNEAGRPVVALDVPSGVDVSTGEVAGPAVSAESTVTFHARKLGLVVAPGLEHAGEVVRAEIGIPPGSGGPPVGVLVGAAAVAALPPRVRGGSKYDAGSLVLIGGSTGMTGAITLASRSSLRAGAGLVVTCVPASLNPILEVKLTEPMTRPCADDGGSFVRAALDTILSSVERADAVVLGPGIGRSEGTRVLVRELLDRIERPLILDADGLRAVGTDLELLRRRAAPTVLTPHGGEASRLLGVESREVRAHRLRSVRAIAERSGAVCLLKGADTLVAAPDGRLAVRSGDFSGLATAGTGDVLSGIVGALLARGIEPWRAAACAAVSHLDAARAALRSAPGRAIIAGDLPDHLALG